MGGHYARGVTIFHSLISSCWETNQVSLKSEINHTIAIIPLPHRKSYPLADRQYYSVHKKYLFQTHVIQHMEALDGASVILEENA